ncbi:hypothetical protein H6P81_018444 [Aristolochia fimbriata]|uniref:Gag-pol polyprotein n=1 Tax=Aristolochia fimbriata TaxID=158543 RepID=A0AAV7E136_ARIFI|nr:hypothetical protein H6P81_018444 [Aristolochia fimbriata]
MADLMKEGASNTRPPLLDGTNYSYWKARMHAYIRALDERAWKSIEKGWKLPTKVVGEGAARKEILKDDSEWTDEDDKLSSCNAKALNAIFGGVDVDQFRRIFACQSAQEAWKILELHFEGTESLLRMHEEETILQYEVKIRDIANQAAALGDKIPENRLVRKVLRSLSSRFKVKVIAIEEHKIVDAMSMDELIGSLKTFEMNEEARDSFTEEKGQEEIDSSCSTITLAELDERVALLAQGLNRFMKKKQKGFKSGERKQVTSPEFQSRKKVLICFECGGRGHIQSECPTYLRKKKSLVASWSEEDNSESENEDCNFVAFTAKYRDNYMIENKHSKASVSELDYENESDVDPVEDILKQWEGLFAVTQELKIKITSLEKEKEHYVKLSNRVAHQIQLRNVHGNKGRVHRYIATSYDCRYGFASICYYCGKNDHIRRHCYKLFWDLKNSGSQFIKRVGTRLVWKKKEIRLYAAHSAITATRDDIWYFDSGCSRHMTGNAACLIDLFQSDGGHVTFDDGAKGPVLGSGTLALEGIPSLADVLLVKGLKANLISISQLCDQNLVVHFTKEGCCVSDSKNHSVLKGARMHDKPLSVTAWEAVLNAVRGLPKISGTMSGVCKGCMEGKQPRTSHPKGIAHEFSTPKTPQQNGVVEHKNRTLQEMARPMIHARNLPHKLWAEAVNTACHIVNRVYLRAKTQTTSYELWQGRSPRIHYFREFGAPCYVLRDREYLSKFDSRSKEGIFVGYSRNSHAYRVYFKQSNSVIESVNVRIDDHEGWLVNDDDVSLDSIEPVSVGSGGSSSETVKQKEDGIFISQEKYAKNLVKKFDLEESKAMRTPMSTTAYVTKDNEGIPADASMYRSMIRSLLYLTASRPDISYSVGNSISLSTAEAEYIAAGSCCGQLIWMSQMLADYGISSGALIVYCDNTSAINILKNPVPHSRTKHIDIRHHFIRDLVEDGKVVLNHISTEKQLADIFTKSMDDHIVTLSRTGRCTRSWQRGVRVTASDAGDGSASQQTQSRLSVRPTVVPYSDAFVTKDAKKKYSVLIKKTFRGELAIVTKEFKLVLPVLEKLRLKEREEEEDAVMLQELTGGKLSGWSHSYSIPASSLTQKYAALHKIAVWNWLPSTHRGSLSKRLVDFVYRVGTEQNFNVGTRIFEHILRVPKSGDQGRIVFPSLIFGILEKQRSFGLNEAMLTKNADMIQNMHSTMPKSRRATFSDDVTATLPHDVSQLCENVSTYIADTLTAIPTDSVFVTSVVSGVSNVLPVPDAVPVTSSHVPAEPASSDLVGLTLLLEFTALGEGSSCFAPPPWPWSPTVPLDDKVMDFLRKRGDIAQKEVVQYEKFARLKRHEVKLIDHLLTEFGKLKKS